MAAARIPMRVGGVPEHFNYPWHYAHDEGWFSDAGIDFAWRDYPEGTGAMAADLAAGRLDAAVLLSEGAVAAISRDTPIRILGWAVTTPLLWGIHAPPRSGPEMLQDVGKPRFAISRYGSGSHLMAHVLVDREGWPAPEFAVVDNLPGAVRALGEGRAELFLWERFTTQPAVDRGELRRIGEIPTPWPAFCLVASDDALQNAAPTVGQLWRVACRGFAAMRALPDLASRIAQACDLAPEEVAQWLELTRWGEGGAVREADLQPVIDRLDQLELLQRPLTAAGCLAQV